jgi:hypothetical protein
MVRTVTVSVKIPKDLYAEMALRISEGNRSNFIREAILEKIEKTPRPNKILDLEQRIKQIEDDISNIRNYLASLEILTFEKGKVNPYTFCVDRIDRKIVDLLLHYRGLTTPEIAEALGKNRWFVLNRIKRIKRSSIKQLGRPLVFYSDEEKDGKRKAWWLDEELTSE